MKKCMLKRIVDRRLQSRMDADTATKHIYCNFMRRALFFSTLQQDVTVVTISPSDQIQIKPNAPSTS
jgi:hypothetical protein